MARAKLKISDLKVGKPLPWAVFTEDGKLLLKKGYVIASESQLEALQNRGLFIAGEEVGDAKDLSGADFNPFERAASLVNRIKQMLASVAKHNPELETRLSRLQKDIDALVKRDWEATLGAIHLMEEESPLLFPLFAQMTLASAIMSALEIPPEEIQDLFLAILIRELSNPAVGKTLEYSDSGQTLEEYFDLIGLDLPKAQGLLSQQAALLKGESPFDQVELPVQVLTLVVLYLQTVRFGKTAMEPQKAVKKILGYKDNLFSEDLLKVFLSVIGLYPSGSYVRLANGEIAVVTRKGTTATTPKAMGILNAKNAPYAKPMPRICADESFAIKEPCFPLHPARLNLSALWGYAKKDF